MAWLLDTNVAIYLRDLEPTVSARVADLSGETALSLVTLVELEGGIDGTRDALGRRAALDALLASMTVLALDRATVAAYATILRETGFSRPRILDRLIAATAIVHGLTLVTVNGADFRDIPDLNLEVWPAPPLQRAGMPVPQ